MTDYSLIEIELIKFFQIDFFFLICNIFFKNKYIYNQLNLNLLMYLMYNCKICITYTSFIWYII